MKRLSKKLLLIGVHACQEGLHEGEEIDRILIRKGLNSDSAKSLIRSAKEKSVPVQFVPKEKLDRLTNLNHQGVLGLRSPISYADINEIVTAAYERAELPFLLVLDHITDVRNLGAMARTAECMGVHAIVIPDRGVAAINDVAIKVSSGALTRIPVCRVSSLARTIEDLKGQGITTIGATEKASVRLRTMEVEGPRAIVMGNEEKGLSRDVMARCDHLVKIDMGGDIGSLNVSVAAGMFLFALSESTD